MSDIRFMCPHCTQSIEAPEDMRGQILDCPNCSKPVQVHELTSPYPPGGRPTEEVKTNVKQGALIGAITCFVIGLLFMFWSLLTFVIYGPLFFASFVLSIVALAQRRIFGGLLLLLSTIIIPPVVGFYLAASRAPAAAEALNQAAADYQREALNSLQRQIPLKKSATDGQPRILLGLPVSGARYYREASVFAFPHIEFTVQNQTGTAVSRIYCHGRLSSPGRTIPWADQDFNVPIPGGLEPGETKQINLRPPENGPYGHGALKDQTDLVMQITVIDAEDASGQRLAH